MTSRTPSRSLSSRLAGVAAGATIAAAALLGVSCKLDKMPFKDGDSRTFAGEVTVSGAELNRGYQSYMRYCYACHGENGDGKGPAAYSLRPPPRDFTRGVFKFARMRGNDDFPNDEDLVRIVKGGLHGTAMLPWDITEPELRRILQYIKAFGPVQRCPSAILGVGATVEDVDGGVVVTVTVKDGAHGAEAHGEKEGDKPAADKAHGGDAHGDKGHGDKPAAESQPAAGMSAAEKEAKINEIRARAKVLAEMSKLESATVGLQHCPVITRDTTITASDVDGGSKITVKPKNEGDVAGLQAESHKKAKETEHGLIDEALQEYRGSRWERIKKKTGTVYPVLEEWTAEDDPWVGKEEAALKLGKELYHLKAECVNCHPGYDTKENLYNMSVEAAKRDSANFSALKGFRDDLYHSQPKRSDEYGVQIMPPDFTMDFVRSAHPETRIKDLYRILSFGVYPIMPAWKGAGLTDSDIYAIAHYVKSLIDMRGTAAALDLKTKVNEQKAFEIPKPVEEKPAEQPAEDGEKKEGDAASDKKDEAKPEDAKKDEAKKDEAKKPEEKK